MLDKLLISKNNAGSDTKRKSILFTTFMVVLSLFSMGMIYSLFSQNLAMGQDSLNISTLIAPPVIPQEKRPALKPENAERPPEKQAVNQVITRKYNIQRMTDSPVKTPKTISTVKPQNAVRPDAPFKLAGTDTPSNGISLATEGQSTSRGNSDSSTLVGIGGQAKTKAEPIDAEATKTIPKPPQIVKPIKKDLVVSKGVLNGKAKHLVMPGYPAAAKAIRLQGKVTIQVMIDENGNVISASPLSGHQLLAGSALRAARASSFTPTYLGDQKVKVRGVIVYNFAQ